MGEDRDKAQQRPQNGDMGAFPTRSLPDSPQELGTQIGRYKLLSVLGEGGFGIVYLAEQKQPVRRQVALKVIKPGMDSKQVIARFEAERQALALLDHPNIARVFDAGTTENGRPYFVMEIVKGLPITEYCDQHNLSIEERLELFRQVCGAMQHAHYKGIIHRDLKPSNILVPVRGDKPVPMIIDFGVAKAISQPLTERTLFTEQGQFIGTPEYMSPEQAGITIVDIDTRSDIYSLGILLYELLTGTLPFSRHELEHAGFAEIQRIIHETDPPRPSTRLTSLGEDATKIAEKRHTEVRTLTKRLHNELEWIPLKAMRKDRDRRYKTASDLAEDVQNYLNGNPLLAGPESATYRFKKFIKKRKGLVAAITAVTAVLIIGLAVSTTLYIRVKKQKAIVESAKIAAENAKIEAQEQQNIAQEERDRAVEAKKAEQRQRIAVEKEKEKARQRAYAAEINIAYQVLEQNSLDRARELLDRQRPVPGQEDLRSFDWRYLWQQCRSDEIASFKEGLRFSVSFSKDGRYLALGASPVVVRDLTLGMKVAELPRYCQCVAFSPRDDYLITVEWSSPTVWDTRTWRPVITLPECRLPVAFSPDGQWLVAGTQDGFGVFDTSSWKQVASCSIQLAAGLNRAGDLAGEIDWWKRHTLAFSPDSRLVVTPGPSDSSGLYELQVRRLPSLELLSPFREPASFEKTAAFSRDGKYLLTGDGGGNVAVWDMAEGTVMRKLRGHESEVVSIVMSPDGKTCFTASLDSSIVKWDMTTWQPVMHFRGHVGQILALAMSPNGKLLASVSDDLTTKLWDTSIRPVVRKIEGMHCVLGFTGDSRSLIAANQQGVVLWDVATGEVTEQALSGLRKIDFYQCWPAVHGTRKILAMGLPKGEPESLGLWDILTGHRIYAWPEFDAGAVTATAVSDDGLLVAAGTTSGDFAVFDIATKRKISPIEDVNIELPMLNRLAFSPDGRYLAMCALEGYRFWIWDLEKQYFKFEHRGNAQIVSLTFSPDGQLLAVIDKQLDVTIWKIPFESDEPQEVLRGHSAFVTHVAFTPDDKSLAVGLWNGVVKLRNRATWQETAMFQVDGNLNTMAFSPDGRYLAIGYKDLETRRIRVLEAPSFKETDAYQQPADVSADADTPHVTDGSSVTIPPYLLEGVQTSEYTADELQELFEHGDNEVFLKWLCREEVELAEKDRRVELIWEDIESARLDEALQRITGLRSMSVHKDDLFSSCITRASKALAGAYCKRATDARRGDPKYDEAIRYYEAAVRADPNYASTLRSLAWLRATCSQADLRDTAKAVDLATKACKATEWKDHRYVATLAAAYAAAGDFDSAVKKQQEAIDLLTDGQHSMYGLEYEARLKLYQSGQPYYGQQLFTEQLIAHWAFDQVSDDPVIDSTDNKLNGKLVGHPQILVDPERGKVLSLDGNDYVHCGNNTAFDIADELTVACWINVNRFDKGWQAIITKGDFTWRLQRAGEKNSLEFGCRGLTAEGDGAQYGSLFGNADVNDGKWHYVAGVYDKQKLYLYVDGVLDNSTKASGYINTNTDPVFIGENASVPGRCWNGLIDDVRIYSYALSEKEIRELYEETRQNPNTAEPVGKAHSESPAQITVPSTAQEQE
jgi:serine/threonine protein kinase/WD40 repeat protein/tetratricopeptide (TPR) repeat protein